MSMLGPEGSWRKRKRELASRRPFTRPDALPCQIDYVENDFNLKIIHFFLVFTVFCVCLA